MPDAKEHGMGYSWQIWVEQITCPNDASKSSEFGQILARWPIQRENGAF